MNKITHALFILAMMFSIVFLSEAISSDNPLAAQAQSKPYKAKPYKRYRHRYHRPWHHYKPCWRTIRWRTCKWIRVKRCYWHHKRVPCRRPYRPHRPYTPPTNPPDTYPKPTPTPKPY